jgi:WD40 repeat protein
MEPGGRSMGEPEDAEPASTLLFFTADFSPDGKTLITAGLDGTLAEWEVETGQRARVLLDPKGVEDVNPRVVWVEDGREVEAPFQLRRLSESMRGSSLLSIRFCPEGKHFAVGAANGEVIVWNSRSRGELFGWRAHEVDVVSLDISPGRKWLATGALEEGGTTFRVWRLQEYPVDVQEVFSDHRHVCGVWAVCFSPDGRLVAAGGWTLSGYTAPQFYEVESGKHFGGFHWDMTRAIRFSPDGKLFVTGDEFGSVKLWSLKQEKPINELKAFEGIVRPVGFSPDGKHFYAGSDEAGVKVWETKTASLVKEYGINGRILACRYGQDGRILLAASAAEDADHPSIHRLQ